MIAIVSGSGLDLSGVFDDIVSETPLSEVMPIPIRALQGHARRLIFGRSAGKEMILQAGRFHLYEGYSFNDVVSTVDLLAGLGARSILFTNVTGGLRPEMKAGALVAISELRAWPCVRWPQQPASILPTRMPVGCDHEDVYFWMHGPSYETPAEIRSLQVLGGGVVGMSTAPEVHRCNELGIESAVVSVVTNNCCVKQILTHADVVATAEQASSRLVALLRDTVAEWESQTRRLG
ncbi:MAG TPA: purine-nucleoside phosphorylase [Candidatus Hydrogenedentes bacterium]|nr:purine-nucleoside phosphorylase [Candidatus Hydrogenedentota bacterium]